MALTPGSKVGIYEVVELIGVGGMGEVYRARDSRLDRAVAIKTLPPEFAADPDRLARFEREAKVLAQLSHPHIASIYGLETGTPIALAMEMADGETLAHRIASGPIAIDDAVMIARQIAEGLEHAHAKGIVHRDLKPANIKVGSRDSSPHVKILDFGLAKAMSNDTGVGAISAVSSPTITSPANLTRAGVVLGTAAYMAPEQARGRNVDHRADIWAFGCVLFEMLTGRRPFEGDEIADVLARVIQSEPDWSLLPAATPSALTTLLKRCLRKDPQQRVHAIADIRIELGEITSGGSADIPMQRRPARRQLAAAALTGLAAGVALMATLFLALRPNPSPATPPRPLRFSVAPPPGYSWYRNTNNGRLALALSPDGEKLAAVVMSSTTDRYIFARRLDELLFREVPGTIAATSIFWAPDNTRFGFTTPEGVRLGELSGGGSRVLTTLPGFSWASWSADDVILASTGDGPLYRWAAETNSPVSTGPLAEGVVVRVHPRWLPGGDFLFVDGTGQGTWTVFRQKPNGQIAEVIRFESVGAGSMNIEYRSGYLLVAVTEPSGRTVLTARPYDLETGVIGDSAVLATDLNVAFSASSDTLVFGDNRLAREQLHWVDSNGASIEAAMPPADRATNFSLSHDERFIALQQATSIVIHDTSRGVTSPLNVRGADPIWSPDDREILYADPSTQALRAVAAFGGSPRLIYQARAAVYPEDWSRDGRWIAAVTLNQGLVIPTAANAKPLEIRSPGDTTQEDELRFSPDGNWLAFGQARGNTFNVFLTALPPSGERWQLSVGGGAQPRWRADGRAVYFLSPTGTLMAVDVTLTPGKTPSISPPRKIFDAALTVQPSLDQYLPTRDGKRFLIRRPMIDPKNPIEQLHVIVNWPSLLKASKAPSQ